jgi:hypothetical protein
MSDAEVLREVLAIAKEYGLQVSTVRAGSVAVAFGPMRAGLPPLVASQLQEVRDKDKQAEDEALPELRRRSMAQFGVVKPDEVLLAMKGAL